MRVYSGKCLIGRCGIATKMNDVDGNKLYVGDIVALMNDDGFHGLTVVVEDGITSYSDGSYFIDKSHGDEFVMGIKSVNLNEDSWWYVSKVKSHSDVVDGENWPNFGFNYSEVSDG
jgi:hypothetical protein